MEKDIEIRAFRWFDSESAKELFEFRDSRGMPHHVRPFSTLIASMGNHWHEGCFEAVKAMAEHTYNAGYDVCFYEEHDRCFNPYDSLGTMRNLAYIKAITQGYEYLLYVDNDVMPEPDALVTLLHKFMPILSPRMEYWDGDDHGQGIPRMEKNRGLAMVGSVPLTFLLFQTKVLMPWMSTDFWRDSLGADEGYHFQKLEAFGHRPFVDTDVTVKVMSPPHYPLDDAGDRTTKELNNFGSYAPRAMDPGLYASGWRNS